MPDLHIDATMGAAGDMILAALVDAGADEGFVQSCVTAVAAEGTVEFERTSRCGMGASRAVVSATSPSGDRSWGSIRRTLTDASIPAAVRDRALAAFAVLAEAEAEVHQVAVADVRFHEVGALDSIVDIVGCCAALVSLQPGKITCGPVATGTGEARTEHGVIPIPSPALVAVLAGTGARLVPGPADFEACTPTAAALLATWTDEWVTGPDLTVSGVGIGAGAADPHGHPNVTRVLLGTADPAADAASGPSGTQLPHGEQSATQGGGESGYLPHDTQSDAAVLETNVDDMDPRLWPDVLQRLLDAGAADAWLTPILMKKGRPAHTLHVLCRPEQVDALAAAVMRHTTAIGLRIRRFTKRVAERSTTSVEVRGHKIRVKVARLGGEVVNVQPEWEDVRAVAGSTGLSAKQVLAQAHQGAAPQWAAPRTEDR